MTLHLYFARRFTMSFLYITAILSTLIFITDLIDQAQESYAESVTFGDIIRLTLLRVPQTINLILPLNMLLATVALFVSLARSSELVVTRAAGRSALKTLMSPVAVAFIIGLMIVGLFLSLIHI